MFGATFGIIAQGLEIFRKSTDIRNRNILNANNPDYAQEDPVMRSFSPAGIRLDDIMRNQSLYYMSLRNQKLSLVSSLDTHIKGNSQVELFFQEFTQGLGGSEYINRFFTAYQNLMKEPTNAGVRSELATSAQTMLNYLRDRGRDLQRTLTTSDQQMRQFVDRVNNLTRKIAQINREILTGYAQTYARGKDYKNLLDERDAYLRELSELISIKIHEDEIGRVRVETDRGFLLVEDSFNWDLRYDSGNRRVFWRSKDGTETELNPYLTGGKIRGMLDFQTDLQTYINQLEAFADRIISEVKLPLNAQATQNWHMLRNLNDPDAALGFSGSITFEFPAGPVTINFLSTDTLNDLINTINTDPNLTGNFSASLVTNPDGTYTLRISSTNPSFTIEDSNGLIHRSEPLFAGDSLGNISLNPNIDNYLQNLDYTRVDEFMNFSRGWWEEAKSLYNRLVDSLASRQYDLKREYDIENALLTSLNTRLQEMQGVSIDNEFIELMKLQRSYEALARTVNIMDEMIQSTINMI